MSGRTKWRSSYKACAVQLDDRSAVACQGNSKLLHRGTCHKRPRQQGGLRLGSGMIQTLWILAHRPEDTGADTDENLCWVFERLRWTSSAAGTATWV